MIPPRTGAGMDFVAGPFTTLNLRAFDLDRDCALFPVPAGRAPTSCGTSGFLHHTGCAPLETLGCGFWVEQPCGHGQSSRCARRFSTPPKSQIQVLRRNPVDLGDLADVHVEVVDHHPLLARAAQSRLRFKSRSPAKVRDREFIRFRNRRDSTRELFRIFHGVAQLNHIGKRRPGDDRPEAYKHEDCRTLPSSP